MTTELRSAIAFYKRLAALPLDSSRRLKHINDAADTADHVLLAIRYGVVDSNIRRLNKTIIGLLLSRFRAERSSNHALVKRINDVMLGLHLAIDWMTGAQPVYSLQHIERSSCNRVRR